jgi:non-ribosomal peptide synthetase component F
VRHRNFTECMRSVVHTDALKESDTVIQMSRCSFDAHVEEIMGILMIGATLIMLHPRGNIDFDYLTTVLREKQISCFPTVPSLLDSFFTFLKNTNNWNVVSCLRTIWSGGEPLLNKLQHLLIWTFLCRREFICEIS